MFHLRCHFNPLRKTLQGFSMRGDRRALASLYPDRIFLLFMAVYISFYFCDGVKELLHKTLTGGKPSAEVEIAAPTPYADNPINSLPNLVQQLDQNPAIKNKYQLRRATLVYDKGDPNGVVMEVGNPTASSLWPELKLSRWGEVSLKVKPEDLSGASLNSLTLRLEGETIQLGTPQVEYVFYDDPAASKEGGYGFDVILKSKPVSNVFSFAIETENLDFFYQPPLNQETHKPNVISCTETQCFDEDGKVVTSRPENVVGSYAVYYKGSPGDYRRFISIGPK
jgi:hypothetical protein